MSSNETELIKYLNEKIDGEAEFLDFKGEDSKYSTHRYHNYPATMIPQIPKFFIEAVSKFQNIKSIYDPFMGSGTTLVESRLHGIDSTGVDLNPLAKLMSDVKTHLLDDSELKRTLDELYRNIEKNKSLFREGKLDLNIPTFKNIDYWFKDYVIIDLELIKDQIDSISNDALRKFFLISFSEAVRFVSNTRNNEFKMYRMAPDKLKDWNPDVIGKFMEITDRNIKYNDESGSMSGNVQTILGTSSNVPEIPDNHFDMLITSPPYGDSKTTVAYGQFSRASLQWLDLEELPANNVTKLDGMLLGGKVKYSDIEKTGSKKLDVLLNEIYDIDKKRALEVSQFYSDLTDTLKEIKRVMKPNSYQFWVTSNRTVKGIQLSTDEIITELYNNIGVVKVSEFSRNIPNKRMPSKNSPTNKKGKTVNTMNRENIVMYKTL